MRIAFYAPLKAPDHPVPSGDRRVAQLFFEALQLAGHQPVLASRLRSFEGRGDQYRQARLAGIGGRLADRALSRWHAAPATARWLVDAVMTGDGDPKQEWLLPRRFPGWN